MSNLESASNTAEATGGVSILIPHLADGETYLYGRVDKNGDVEHTVVIAVNNERLTHAQQREWAKSVGGVLFNRVDALFVYNEHRELVQPEAYFTDDEVEWDDACAWYQGFYGGGQDCDLKGYQLRAVAVRRFKN